MRIIVVNGEPDWDRHFPGHDVVRHRIQDATWVLREGRLFALDRHQAGPVDAVLWRVGAIRPDDKQRVALEMIRLAGVPCVNAPEVLLRNFDRLGMLASLRRAGLPMPPSSVVSDTEALDRLQCVYPRVLKVGGLHGGYGKAKVDKDEDWGQIRDLVYASATYATVEPYVSHTRDVRCLLIGDDVYAMERRGAGWRANVDTVRYRLVDVPPALEAMTRTLALHLGASLIAVDALDTDGGWVVMESNETPGLAGFPECAAAGVANLLLAQLRVG